MKRRNFLKLGLFASLGVAGSAGLLKIYKHATGAGDILQYPDPTLRRVAAPVNVIDSSFYPSAGKWSPRCNTNLWLVFFPRRL